MKKVLLATTVLALSAGIAAADVTVTGTGRMGVAYNSEAPNKMGFTSRVRVIFGMSGETDGGLAFGATIRADNAGAGNGGTSDVNGAGSQTAGSIFVSGAFGKLSFGDVSSAAELVVGDLDGVGLTGLGDLNENIYFGNAGSARTAARYEYTTGGLTFAVSADNPQFDTKLVAPAAPGVGTVAGTGLDSNTYGVGVKYAVDNYAVALGYETTKIYSIATGTYATADHIIVGGEATFAGVKVKAVYGDASDVNLDKQYGLSATYTQDALSLTAFYRVEEFLSVAGAGAGGAAAPGKFKYAGIGAAYDLGGGASLVGGLVDVNRPGLLVDETRADFGISLKF